VCIAERGTLGGAAGSPSRSIVAGLMKIRPPAFTAARQVIQKHNITSTPTTLLPSANYKFVIVLFLGDLTLTVQRGASSFTLTAADQAIELVVNINESLQTTASSGTGSRPTIEIVSLQ